MNRTYIALGANLEQPIEQLNRAVNALIALAADNKVTVSSYYRSVPMGDVEQPDYVNAVACFDTPLCAFDLLDALQSIELEQGRQRLIRWGPRTLDLDILLFNQDVISSPRLTIPHYGMKQRSFVLIPLAEIAPQLRLPCGESIHKLISQTMRDELEKLD